MGPGVNRILTWMYTIAIILASVPLNKADNAEMELESERFKRAALFGSFAGYGGGPPPFAGPAPAVPGYPVGPIAPVPGPAVIEPVIPVAPGPPMGGPVGPGVCPGGPSLGKPCDAKRPWPQCPPSSYCYAVNTVDIGPYYCCPVWSTVGAQWRPAAPFYPYYPPMPYNWPYIIQATAHWGAQTSPASGWLGQFGPAPGGPVGPVGGAVLAPAVPDGPYPAPGPLPGPGPFDKRKKEAESAAAPAPAEKEASEKKSDS